MVSDDDAGNVKGEPCGKESALLVDNVIGEDIGTAVNVLDIGMFIDDCKSDRTVTGD